MVVTGSRPPLESHRQEHSRHCVTTFYATLDCDLLARPCAGSGSITRKARTSRASPVLIVPAPVPCPEPAPRQPVRLTRSGGQATAARPSAPPLPVLRARGRYRTGLACAYKVRTCKHADPGHWSLTVTNLTPRVALGGPPEQAVQPPSGSFGPLAGLGEHRQGDLVAAECPGGARVGRQMDEELNDLLLGHAGVQRYPQLPVGLLMSAERGGGDERPAAVIQPRCRARSRRRCGWWLGAGSPLPRVARPRPAEAAAPGRYPQRRSRTGAARRCPQR